MKTPQEKKLLSYAKDRRNTYGENSKASRKAIPLNKALALRAERHVQNRILSNSVGASDSDELTALENDVRSTKPRQWAKSPDTPLGQVVPRRLNYRSGRIGAKLARRVGKNER